MRVLEGERCQRSEPSKPRRTIGDQRQHALSGRNDHHTAVSANLDEWQSARTRPGRLRLDSLWSRCLNTSRTRSPGKRGSRRRHDGGGWLGSEALAKERQGQFRDLGLQGGHLLTQQTQLLVQVVGIRPGTDRLSGGGGSRHSPCFLSGEGQGLRQRTTMQLGQLLELCKGKTFETSICGMQTTGELGSGSARAAGFWDQSLTVGNTHLKAQES